MRQRCAAPAHGQARPRPQRLALVCEVAAVHDRHHMDQPAGAAQQNGAADAAAPGSQPFVKVRSADTPLSRGGRRGPTAWQRPQSGRAGATAQRRRQRLRRCSCQRMAYNLVPRGPPSGTPNCRSLGCSWLRRDLMRLCRRALRTAWSARAACRPCRPRCGPTPASPPPAARRGAARPPPMARARRKRRRRGTQQHRRSRWRSRRRSR